MRALTRDHICYIAGIFDGEGHCGVGKTQKHYQIASYSVKVCVTNTDFELLEWLETTTGIGKIDGGRKATAIWKAAKSWNLVLDEMPEFLRTIQPFCIVKQERIDLTLQFIELCHGQNPGSNGNKGPELQEMVRKEFLYWELRELNKRGQ